MDEAAIDRPQRHLAALREAALVVLGCAALGLGANAVRSDGIPFVQREPYQILVPCPDVGGEILSVASNDPSVTAEGSLVLDARASAEFAAWHLPNARSLPYDYLEPVAAQEVQQILKSGAHAVVVYGDGADPDSGRELARELAGQGIRNVRHVQGGAPALRSEVRR